MRVIDRVDEFVAALEAERVAGRTVGLVPTMGALHEGHASLVERAAADCDTVCVSVFVNPLQFGPAEDLANYPRDPEGDRRRAGRAGASLVFAPSEREMLPSPPLARVRVQELSEVLEGVSRPGHFDGVATVVAKLFAMAGRCRVYFGEKDYQQLLVVRRLAADLSFPVEVVGCPTVRDLDGVALSSRNRYLSAEEREAAAVLFRALRAGAATVVAGERDPGEVTALMAAVIEAEPLVHLDYAEVVGAETLAVPEKLDGQLRLLVAARVGHTRLIDNLGIGVA